jgi:hypothetical protein
LHDELERICKPAMDFSKVEQLAERINGDFEKLAKN